jgi:hypothetical protein
MANKNILYDERMLKCKEDVLDESNCFCEDIFDEGEEMDELICETPKSCRTRSYRRKREIRYKKKLRCNSIDAMNNFKKREQEDFKNISFCKCRNGHLVKLPKSLTMKAEKIWGNAVKMKLL